MSLRRIFTTHIGMNYFAFLGGIQISAVISLYVNLYDKNFSLLALLYIIIGGLLTFFSGYFSMVLTWNCSEIIEEGEKTQGTVFDKEEKMNDKLNEIISIFGMHMKRITKMKICLFSDVVLIGIGLIIIILSKIWIG